MDISKFIIPTKLDDAYLRKNISTQDLVYLDAKNEVEKFSDIERITYPTDYAVMNGVFLSESGDKFSKRKSCYQWLRSAPFSNYSQYFVNIIDHLGKFGAYNVSTNIEGLCPSLHLNISSVISAQKKSNKFFNIYDIVNNRNKKEHIIQFGEYPKTFVGEKKNKELENLYSLNKLSSTGKTYTGRMDQNGAVISHSEFEHEGQKYVRVLTKKNNDGIEYCDGTRAPKDGTLLWVKVEPIEWKIKNWDELPEEINPIGTGRAKYIDVKAKDTIIAGIPFHVNFGMENCSMWQNSVIRAFLNSYDLYEELNQGNGDSQFETDINYNFKNKGFLNEAFDGILLNIENESKQEPKTRQTRLQKLAPKKFQSDFKTGKMSVTDELKMLIDIGAPVLLRGASGIGKTQRVRDLCEEYGYNLVYLRLFRNMLPELIMGSTDVAKGKSIPPIYARLIFETWATEEEKKIMRDDPQKLFELAPIISERAKTSDKKAVLLLDELLNVDSRIQSLVFSLVLDKFLECGSGIKFPDNMVVVATGNPKMFSQSAEELSSPLQKRFSAIIDVEPNVQEWIFEYAIPRELHPKVIGFILSKYEQNRLKMKTLNKGLDENLSYFIEGPDVGENNPTIYDDAGRTNDPRNWEHISNWLYHFEKEYSNGAFDSEDIEINFKNMLLRMLRPEWAVAFADFYNNEPITVEEIIDDTYSTNDLPITISEKVACTMSLLSVDIENVEKVRNFIREKCSPEFLEIFDLIWTKDEERYLKIEELNAKKREFEKVE